MRIVCPLCSSAYEVPDAMLAGGRRLACVRCLNEWVPELPEKERQPADELTMPGLLPESEVPALAPLPPPRDVSAKPEIDAPAGDETPPLLRSEPRFSAILADLRRERARPDRRLETILVLGASVLIMLGAFVGIYVYRQALMDIWPPSQRLFSALHLR